MASTHAKSSTKPGPEFDGVKASIRDAGRTVTPFNLGLYSAGLANPYSSDSYAHALFRDAADWAKRKPIFNILAE